MTTKWPEDGPKMVPKWSQDGLKVTPKWCSQILLNWLCRRRSALRDGPKWPQDGPRRAEMVPRWPEDGPKMAPRWPLTVWPCVWSRRRWRHGTHRRAASSFAGSAVCAAWHCARPRRRPHTIRQQQPTCAHSHGRSGPACASIRPQINPECNRAHRNHSFNNSQKTPLRLAARRQPRSAGRGDCSQNGYGCVYDADDSEAGLNRSRKNSRSEKRRGGENGGRNEA